MQGEQRKPLQFPHIRVMIGVSGVVDLNYELRRSDRRTVSIEVRPDGGVLVRAPRWASRRMIEQQLLLHRDWITARQEQQARRSALYPEPDAEQERALRQRASEFLPPLTALWAAQMGVTPTAVRITSARTRYGSCSGKDSICFSWRLMQYPEPAIEAVVVHELAHIRHKNHSRAFYAEVERWLPDYRQRIALLKAPKGDQP